MFTRMSLLLILALGHFLQDVIQRVECANWGAFMAKKCKKQVPPSNRD
jgi:hypothetical protein